MKSIFNRLLEFIFLIFIITNRINGQELVLNEDEIALSIKTHLHYESDNHDSLLVYKGFVVAYNCELHVPNLVFHKLSNEQINPEQKMKAKRRSTFFVDEYKLKDKSATNADYKYSGFDKGHMVPAGDFYWDKNLKDETFVFSNICPQNPNLNRGIWANLENAIREKLLASLCDGYIITGIIFSSAEIRKIGINDIGIPEYLFKLIYIPKLEVMYAFLFDNSLSIYSGNLTDYQVRVDDIERIINQDFFEVLPDSIESILESKIFLFSNGSE